MTMTQMNTRIDATLKARGDAVFSALGLSTSEVVRAVWGYAAEHGDAPAIVAQALGRNGDIQNDPELAYRTDLAKDACDYVANYRRQAGLAPLDLLETIDYRTLREEAWEEKLSERGLSK